MRLQKFIQETNHPIHHINDFATPKPAGYSCLTRSPTPPPIIFHATSVHIIVAQRGPEVRPKISSGVQPGPKKNWTGLKAKKKNRKRVELFRFRAKEKKVSTLEDLFCFNSSYFTISASCNLYSSALSLFAVQMEHMFISCRFYSTSKLSHVHHLTPYKQLWQSKRLPDTLLILLIQSRFNSIYTNTDLSTMSIKTLYIAHHGNAHNNHLHCGETTSP